MRRSRRCLAIVWFLAALAGRAAAATPPPVLFQVESETGRPAAQLCHELWQARGAEVTAALLPGGASADTVVCLVLDSASFARHFASRLPDWGVGVALWPGRVIAIDHERAPAVRGGAREIFLHEMTHALLMQAARRRPLARLAARGRRHAPVRRVALAGHGERGDRRTTAVARPPARPVPDAAEAAADQAYRASLLAVNLLEHDHGPGAVARIARAAADSGDFRAGFAAATGRGGGGLPGAVRGGHESALRLAARARTLADALRPHVRALRDRRRATNVANAPALARDGRRGLSAPRASRHGVVHPAR